MNDHCILTAAQCTNNVPNAALSVRVGSTTSQTGGQLFQVDYVDNHHNFNPATLVNDLSVIHVVGHLHFSATVQAIGMPAQGAGVPAGAIATVSGWGSITEGGAFSPILQSANVPVVTNAACNQFYAGRITDGMICAGFAAGNSLSFMKYRFVYSNKWNLLSGGADACNGDNGGPLTFGNQVVGIVSLIEGCGRPNMPGVYTRIAHFRQWIDEHTHDH